MKSQEAIEMARESIRHAMLVKIHNAEFWGKIEQRTDDTVPDMKYAKKVVDQALRSKSSDELPHSPPDIGTFAYLYLMRMVDKRIDALIEGPSSPRFDDAQGVNQICSALLHYVRHREHE